MEYYCPHFTDEAAEARLLTAGAWQKAKIVLCVQTVCALN